MPDEHYEKRGRTARIEWLRGILVRHMLDERGLSRQADGVFTATAGESLIAVAPPPVTAPDVSALLKIGGQLGLQRIIASSGNSVHRFEHESISREWEREDHLVHVEFAIPQSPFTMSLEWLSDPREAATELETLASLIAGSRTPLPFERIVLESRTTAAMLSARIACGVLTDLTQNPSSERDGDGREIEKAEPSLHSEPPNRVRVSYRYPARRAWTHCTIRSQESRIDDDLPRGMAPLVLRYDRHGAQLVLMLARGADWCALELAGDWESWIDAIGNVSEERTLYPFAPAPQFGSRCILDTARLSPRWL